MGTSHLLGSMLVDLTAEPPPRGTRGKGCQTPNHTKVAVVQKLTWAMGEGGMVKE